MTHQERIVLGGEDIHGDGGLDSVFIQHLQDAEDANTVSILPMRPGRDVREGALAIATSEVGNLVAIGGTAPFHVLEGDDHAEGYSGVLRPGERRATGIQGRPIIMIVIHPSVQLWEYVITLDGHTTPP